MNRRERGFLLLTSHLGDPDRKVLTPPQLRTLAQRLQGRTDPLPDRELELRDLLALGYGRDFSQRILTLLSQEDVLEYYLRQGIRQSCIPVTRVSAGYPALLRKRLGLDSPGCLWCKGDPGLLNQPAISLVGSRELELSNRRFAEAVGRQAARQNLVLISGNARGADRAAQDACLEAGGRVVSVLADRLDAQEVHPNVCYVSLESYDEAFSSYRALNRNRVIHCLGRVVFVAQCRKGQGGTWDGTVKNLRSGWSSVACFDDGSEGARELEQMGAFFVKESDILDMTALLNMELTLF